MEIFKYLDIQIIKISSPSWGCVLVLKFQSVFVMFQSSVTSRVVNQLLTEMDGLEARKSVFIMGATNRPGNCTLRYHATMKYSL